MRSFFSKPPKFMPKDYDVLTYQWENSLTQDKKIVHRFVNDYDKGLVKKGTKDVFWKNILEMCDDVEKYLSSQNGSFYYHFYELPEDRSLKAHREYLETKEPKSFKTIFMSGFLVERKRIRRINGGFYISPETPIPVLSEVVNKLLPQKSFFPSFIFNFGYYYTKVLLDDKEYGYNKTRRAAGLEEECISNDWKSYLGPSIWNESNHKIVNPPLFNKSWVLFKKNGEIKVGRNWQLGGGTAHFLDVNIDWKGNSINSNSSQKVQVHTPFENNKKAIYEENWAHYQKFVGKNRVNFVILTKGVGQNVKSYISLVKKGEVMMPPMGIVISLSEDYFASLFSSKIANNFDRHNYYIPQEDILVEWNITFPFKDSLEDVNFLYGGFLPLVYDGYDYTQSTKDLESLMIEQGFFHPHSRQSQETPIEKPYEREPRAVFVVVENKEGKEEYGYFSFSGRYEESIGIDLFEVVPLLKKAIRGKRLKHVIHLDSGSAVKLLFATNPNKIKVLNLTAISMRSFIGEFDKNVYNMISMSI